MWVYQEPSVSTPAASHDHEQPPVRKASTAVSAAEITPVSGTPKPVPGSMPRNRQISRDCFLLAVSYLFGALLSGVMLALCQTSELDRLSAYLANWSGLFALEGPGSVWDLFGAEYLTAAGGATILLLLGLSAFGPVLIYLFAMLFGLGIGVVQLQLFLQSGWKTAALALFLTGIPTAAAVTCLCLFGASALGVSGRLQTTAFGKKACSTSSGARRLMGQYLVLNVLFLPICGVSTALVCLVHQLSGGLPG